jgi:hypothetical protein
MDRINIKCVLAEKEVELQLDKKAMPGETGPCFMITEEGCFKGYIARTKIGSYRLIGSGYYNDDELHIISRELSKLQYKRPV